MAGGSNAANACTGEVVSTGGCDIMSCISGSGWPGGGAWANAVEANVTARSRTKVGDNFEVQRPRDWEGTAADVSPRPQ